MPAFRVLPSSRELLYSRAMVSGGLRNAARVLGGGRTALAEMQPSPRLRSRAVPPAAARNLYLVCPQVQRYPRNEHGARCQPEDCQAKNHVHVVSPRLKSVLKNACRILHVRMNWMQKKCQHVPDVPARIWSKKPRRKTPRFARPPSRHPIRSALSP